MTISLSVVKRYPLIEKHSEKYGGGGHIHFRLKKDSLKTLRNLFIDFANSYLNYIDKISKQNKLVNLEISTEEQIYKLTKDDKCIDEFYKLLKILGLSRRRYKKYIDTNYEWRKQSGFWTIKEGE